MTAGSLSRAGIPHRQEPNVRALCGGRLSPEKALEALKQLYGEDHRPERRDVKRAGHRAQAKVKTYYACGAAEWEDDWYDEYEEDAYYEDDEGYLAEDEEPEELDEALEACEEAHATWQEARMKITELARARGF